MTDVGFTISGSDHPISPVMLGDAKLAAVMADDLLTRGTRELLRRVCLAVTVLSKYCLY